MNTKRMIERVLHGENPHHVVKEATGYFGESVDSDAEQVQNELGSDYEVKVLQGDDDPYGPPVYTVSRSGGRDLGVLYASLSVVPGKYIQVDGGTEGIGGGSKKIYGPADPESVVKAARKYIF